MNGILLVDKPQDWTSHDVVAKLRGVLKEKKIGHAGTLDPMATGLLVVLVGRATRAAEYAEAGMKKYTARLKLGLTTDTQDIWGNVLTEIECHIDKTQLERVLPRFIGDIQQIPPMYSAIKVDGERLYKAARRGEEVDRLPRPIHVESITIGDCQENEFMLNIVCSKGTYVRTLCHDIGKALGCGGVMSGLRRVAVGAFSVWDAYQMQAIETAAENGFANKLILPPDRLFGDRPSCLVGAETERLLRNGTPAPCDARPGEYRVYSADSKFLLLGRSAEGKLSVVKSFYEV